MIGNIFREGDKLKKIVKILTLIIIAAAGGLLLSTDITNAHAQKLSNQYVHSTTPTLFFHGFGSGAHAEKYMVNGIVKAGVSKTVVVANVASDGTVTIEGNIPKGAVNPLVEVNFSDNHNSDYPTQGQWVKNVLEVLQQKYHVKKVNIEAHSMGNMAVMYYLLDNAGNHNLPQIQKQAAMAGTFDGAIGWNEPANLTVDHQTGKPSAMNAAYEKLLPLRHRFPRQIKVLNIYGDLGNGNDTQVTNNSCRTLKYIINGRARSYKEVKITGPNAKHELLHHNPEVNKLLINFFWRK